MKVASNDKLIERNKKIGRYTSVGSLVILGLGMYLSFQTTNTNAILLSLVALILGFLLSQVGIFYGNRFGRSPRPDEQLTASLKGLEEKYTLYHYSTSIPHLLVGPAGVWALLPFPQGGTITYDEKKNRWKQKGGNTYLKIFAQESMGRPDLDSKTMSNDNQKLVDQVLQGEQTPRAQAVLVFTNPKAQVDAANAPIPTITVDKLKDFFRKQAKENPYPLEVIRKLQDSLPKPE